MRGKGKPGLWLVPALGLFVLLIRKAPAASEACAEALRVCALVLIPSLFPFFVLSGFLCRLGLPELLGRLLAPAAARLFGVSGAGASALLIGLTGGYPAGAVYLADMARAGAVTPREAERLLAFCNNSGPAFLVGAVGVGVFGSARVGLLLYGVHVCAALLTGLFFRGKAQVSEKPVPRAAALPPAAALTEAVKQAAAAILNVCAFAAAFSVLPALFDPGLSRLCAAAAERFGFAPVFLRAMLTGFFELGSGAAAMRGLCLCPAALAEAAFLVGWGGLSVQFQTLGALEASGIRGSLHPAGRLLSACIGAALAFAAGVLLGL